MENHHFEDVNHRTKWAMASSSLTTCRAEDWQDWLKMEKPATARVHPGRPGQELSLALEGSMETHRVRSLRSHFVSSSSKNVQHIFRTDLFSSLSYFSRSIQPVSSAYPLGIKYGKVFSGFSIEMGAFLGDFPLELF